MVKFDQKHYFISGFYRKDQTTNLFHTILITVFVLINALLRFFFHIRVKCRFNNSSHKFKLSNLFIVPEGSANIVIFSASKSRSYIQL